MNIYVTRHGQTDNNIKMIMNGKSNIDINQKGISQAMQARDILSKMHIDLIFCSPLTRTKHTMQIINQNNIPVIFDNRIVERDCGEFAGYPYSQVDARIYWNYNDKTNYIKVEKISELFKRVYSFLDEIKEKYYNKSILIITHKGTSKAIQCYFEGIPQNGDLSNLGLNNCEIKKYAIEK